jgi:hypothetical protein
MNLTIKHAALTLALVATFGTAQATSLVANMPTANVDIVASSFGGTLLASAITNVSNLSYNGIARSAVYDTGTGLDFYYQFSNNTSSVNGIERFTAFNFASLGASAISVYQTAANFGIFAKGTESSDYADRSLSNVIGFSFVPNGASKINPGFTSFTQVIRTNARSYTAGNFGILDGVASNAGAFAPAAPVPEPETYAMLLAGLGLMGGIARRKLKNK